ncbi:MAG: hypothetical protein J6X84_09045, partial [Treponema sp.]|nr:hypothetical protein [Treponema sp.]
MKKNIFIILLLLIFVSCTKKNSASSSAKEISVPDEYVGIWIISNPNYSFLQIEKNGNFSIRSMSEIYKGTVEIEENKIILPYSEKFYCGPVGEFENILEIDTIFPDKKDTLFTYNENYRDLNYKTCLENSIYQFPSREKKSEVGEIYQLNFVGVEVLKINKSIVSTENVKLKFRPYLNEKQL